MGHAIHRETRGRLALLLIVPALVSAVMWLMAREESRQVDSVQHALLVELSLERLIANIGEAESSQRGYLLTGASAFLNRYSAATDEARKQLSNLDSLTSDNAVQQSTVMRIRPMVERRLGQFDGNIQLYRAGNFERGGKTNVERGMRATDAIRSLANTVYEEEQRLLMGREDALSEATWRFWWSLAFGYGVIMLAGGSLYRNVKRYGQQRAEAEGRLASLNADLDRRVRERTARLQAGEELMKTFVKHVPAAVAMLDRDMRYLQVSDRWCTDYSLGSSEILGRSHYEVFPNIPERWKQIHRRCLSGETAHEEQDRFDRGKGSTIWLHWEIRPWGNKNSLPEGILIFTEDVTQRKHTEELLRESEATTRALLDTASQAIIAVDSAGVIAEANQMAGEMFGYPLWELMNQPHDILLPERFRDVHEAHRADFYAHPRPRPMGTGLILVGRRKDGSEFPIEVSLSHILTRRGPLAVSFVSDIGPRIQAEVALRDSEQQLRALAGSLLNAQEDERRRLARDLHDDVTQRLAFLSIELGKLAAEVPGTAANVGSRLRALQKQSLNASIEVRRLSHGLHPSVISDFGLSVALEDFCHQFEKAQGIPVRFEGFVEDSRLEDASATCLYRVAQESMHNAVMHGNATEVKVLLSALDGSIQLQVIDNGRGFPTEATRPGLGIISMRERIRLISGHLAVSSEPGGGTTIVASVPLTGSRHE